MHNNTVSKPHTMVKHVPRLFCLLVALCLLGIAAAMAWVSHVPRDVSFLIPRVEASLNPKNAPIRLTIENAHIDWRLWSNFGRISIGNVRVLSEGDKEFAALPSIQVKLSPIALLSGSVGIDWIIIPRSDLVLTSTAERQLMLGLGDSENTIPLSSLYTSNEASSQQSMVLPFNHLLLEDANVTIRDPSGKLLLRTYKSELSFSRENYGFQGAFRLNFTYRDQIGATQSILRYYQRDKSLTVASKLVNVPIGLICGIAGDCGPLNTLRGAITGKAAINLRDGIITDGDIVLSGERLRFTQPEWFADPLEFSNAAISATIANDMQQIDVRTVTAQNSELTLVASGNAERKADGWYANMVAKQNGLNIKYLYKYWPVSLAPETRAWVIGGIPQGMSPEAIATVTLKPEDFKAELLPSSFLSTTIQVQNATVIYLPGLAPVKGVDGTVQFTGDSMRADVGGGTLLKDTTLKRAVVVVPNFNHPSVPMETELQLDASASDVATLFQHKAFTFDDTLKLDKNSVKGRLNGKVALDFDAFAGNTKNTNSFDVSGVDYDIDIGLTGIGQNKLMGAYDVSGFTGALKANAQGFSLNGKGSMNASPLEIAVEQKSGGSVRVGAKGAMTRQNLVGFGMPDRKEIGEGTIGFDAGFMLGKDTTQIESIALDLKDVGLNVNDISWSKARGIPSNLTLSPISANRYSISHKGGDLSVKGQVSLNPKTQVLESLNLSNVTSANNNFALSYESVGKGMRVKLTGARFDNSASFMSESEPDGENNILANFPHLHLTLDIAELVLTPAQPLRNLKGTLDCLSGPCVLANITGNTGEKGTLSAHISRQSGTRTLEIKASDAGELLRAIDATDKVNRGDLHFDGAYQGDSLVGRLIIKDFNVKQSQVLARLFSVASLSGMANLLTGSGIDFEKLRADVTHKQGIFTLKEARANGASIGYTTEGTVNTRNATLNLKGVLVPAYALNSIVGKIPLIGAIAGGEGEGLISFNYSIKGKYADPEVSVNPLSGLTPGFLRGIFDAGDSDAATESSGGNKKGPATPIRERR